MNAQSKGAPASLPDFVPVIIVGAGPTGITAATTKHDDHARAEMESLLNDLS